MKCPNCQTENREGRKFCGQCGAKLSWKCPDCGFDNEADDKFCGGCGKMFGDAAVPSIQQTTPTPKLEDMHARLQSVIPQSLAEKYTAALQADSRENRPVTALFADISGFTPLSTKLSSEAVFQLVEECFNTLVNIVAGYEGKISGFRGDGLLALFGAPILHENDAERAIIAALDMRNAMTEKQLQMSVGVNTATMTVGEITTTLHSEYTAHSVEVNLAARLQQAAQPGQILVGAGTYRLTRRAFDFQRIEGLSLRGIGEGIVAYEALHVKEHPEKLRGIEGLRARMIGREREFADLKEAADKLLSGEGQMVSIIGEAGIGKSRLVSELKTYMNEKKQTSEVFETSEVYTLEGRCVSIGNTISYWPILDMLRSYFGLSEDESEKDVARKVVENITRLFPQRADDILPFFGHLMSIRFGNELDEKLKYFSPEQIMHQTLMRLRDFFVTIAREKPLLLILEDLHWSDALSLELIMSLMDELVTTPLMLLCVYRPSQETEIEPRLRQLPGIAERKCVDRYTEINLKQLSTLESRQLVETLLAIDNLPESVKEMILKRSEGNPFFIEEVIRSLLDRDLIYREGERWKARREIIDLNVPDTIQSVILARVDRLESEAKYVLQCASVIGRLFKYRLLEHLSRQERNLDRYLNEFEERDLVYEERAIPELEYAFKHALTQETTYQGILEQRRQQFHHQVAQGIEALYRERTEEYYEELAYHYGRSRNQEKTLEYLIKSADKAARRYDNTTAIEYYTQAIELLGQSATASPTELSKLYEQRGDIHLAVYDCEEAIEDFENALEYAEKGTARAKLYAKIGDIYAWHIDNGEEALQYSRRAIAEIDDSEKSLDAAQTYLQLAAILSWWHRRMESASLIHKAIQIAEERDDREMLAWCYSSASRLYALWSVPERLQEMYQKAKRYLPELQRSGNLFLLARVNTLLGFAAREETEKIEFFTRGIEYAEKSGFQALLPMAARALGGIYERGELDKALEMYQKGWRICLATRSLLPIPGEPSVTYCIGKDLLNLYLKGGEGSKVVEMFGELADVTLALLTKPRVPPDVANRWRRNVFEALATHLYRTSGEIAVQVQALWQARLAQTDNQDERCFYHVQWMKYAWEESDTDNAKLQAQKALQLGETNGVRTTMLNQSDRVLMYLLLGDVKTANQVSLDYLCSQMESYQEAAPVLQPSADYIKLESIDAFDGDSLSPAWEWIDPKADCAYKLLSPIYRAGGISPSGLQITVPPKHNLWMSNHDAPRLLQTIAGDFAIETMISDGEGGRKSGGLLVWKNEDNYIRFETPSSSPNEGEVRFEANVKGNYIIPGCGLPDAKILALRLERQGHRFSAYCSVDGENWLTCGWVDLPMVDDPIQVGIHALCPAQNAPTTSTGFEYFKVWRRDS